MSECKKTCGNCAGLIRSVLSKDRCDMTNKPIENYSSTCKDWEPNRDTEVVMQKDELKSLRKERDELQAQVALLRGALETVVEMGTYRNDGYASEDMLEEPWATVAENALASTPSEAAERVNALVGALERIEQSGTGTLDGVVVLTQEAKLARQALAEWRKNK